jgi:signal transduction histidine kinase
MSHKIRTPMNSIIGFTELLADEALTSAQMEYVDYVQRSANSLLSIINDILDFSKIEAGKLSIETIDTNLNDVLDSIQSLLKSLGVKKNLRIEVMADDNLPSVIKTDPLRRRQCLTNLINNAVKFTEKGHVLLNVTAGTADGRGFIRFDVEDTGTGIPEDKLCEIFESFSQVDGSTTRKYGGTGLGLAITKQLAGLMGGTLTVASQLGVGSTFSLVLPTGINIAEPAAVCNSAAGI